MMTMTGMVTTMTMMIDDDDVGDDNDGDDDDDAGSKFEHFLIKSANSNEQITGASNTSAAFFSIDGAGQ